MESEISSFPHEIHRRAIAQFEQAFEIAAISRTEHLAREPQFRARKESNRKHARDGEERKERELLPENVVRHVFGSFYHFSPLYHLTGYGAIP